MMQSSLYVSYSGQIALERRLATIANNIANSGTVGYRAEELKFDTVFSNLSNDATAFSSAGKSYLSEKSGGMKQTGNPLDVAIQGPGWMAIQTAAGTAYTRDGRMMMKSTGELLTLNGNAILDAGGSPITMDPNAGPPRIDHDGNVSQLGRNTGKIGLYAIDVSNGYLRAENSSIIPSTSASAIESFTADGFAQGFVEESNVNAVTEMTNLIMITRAFDGLQTSIDESETSLKKAIQVLSGG
jgi:flagellar basal-body rod protein FlgF